MRSRPGRATTGEFSGALGHPHSAVLLAARAGVDGIEHFSCLTESGPQIDGAATTEVTTRGIVVDPTAGLILDAVRNGAPPPAHIVESMTRLGLTPEYFVTRRIEEYGLLHEAGVTVVTGTDGGVAPMSPHGIAGRAVHELVLGGWPVVDALRTATSTAADSFGLATETGRLRPGLAADLLVVDKDLRQSFEAISAPTHVLVRGVGVTQTG